MKMKDSIVVDYLLVVLYFVIVAICAMTVIFRWDIMMRWVLPLLLFCGTTGIFGSYLRALWKISKKKKANAEQ